MPHIKLPDGLPGIIGPMTAYPETAKPLNELAHRLLSEDTPTFTKAERETVASYVSFLNECQFCSESHAAVADAHWGERGRAKEIWQAPESQPPRLAAYLKIARMAQTSGRAVSVDAIQGARELGATDKDLHDCVLIAAAFCLYNRYVDGLQTFAPPRGDQAYDQIGRMLAQNGYIDAI